MAKEDMLARLIKTLEANGLPVSCGFRAEELFEKAVGDKKREGDRIHLIAVKELGKAEMISMELVQLKELIRLGLA